MTYEKQGLFVDEAHLEHYAENLARGWKLTGEMCGRADAAALRRTLHELDALHAELQRRWASDPAMPGAVRWLLDNRSLARREGLNACAPLRAARSLRRTADGTLLSLLSRALERKSVVEGKRVDLGGRRTRG